MKTTREVEKKRTEIVKRKVVSRVARNAKIRNITAARVKKSEMNRDARIRPKLPNENFYHIPKNNFVGIPRHGS